MKSEIRVGFAGNPNCGKTTLFNAYTGANLKVANWPGVTVEKKEGETEYKGRKTRISSDHFRCRRSNTSVPEASE